MEFIGMWKNEETDELIEFENSDHSDAYHLHYDYNSKTNKFEQSELIPINKSGNIYRIMKSELFGGTNLFLISDNKIQISDSLYQKNTIEK